MSDIVTVTGLQIDSVIKVRVRSLNTIEWGPYSQLNTVGALV